MPQLFAQLKQTEGHISVFERTPLFPTGKTGTCFHRLHISKRAQEPFGNISVAVSFIHARSMSILFLFWSEPTAQQKVGSNNQLVWCAGLRNTLLTFGVRASASLQASATYSYTLLCVGPQRCWRVLVHSLMLQHHNDLCSCQIWLQFSFGAAV